MKHVMIAAVIGCLVTTSCNQVAGWFGTNSDSTSGQELDSSSYAAFVRDESITQANAYSDLFLDSTSLEKYIQDKKVDNENARALRNFYLVRNYQYAWFTTNGLTEQGRGLWNLSSADSIAAHKDFKNHMDSLVENDSLTIPNGDTSFVQTELSLTNELIQIAHTENNGLINASNFYYLVPSKKQDPLQMADSILKGQTDSTLYKGNKPYASLKQQLAIYFEAAKDSSWQALSSAANNLKKGAKSDAVTAIKKRLQVINEYTTADTSNVFTDSLETALKEYQKRNGLAPTGVVNDSLITVLNITPQQRVEQILVNMNRMLWMHPVEDSSRVVVNIPSLMLEVFTDSGHVVEMPVIVGKEGTSTLMFNGDISKIVFNPTWTIPESIVKNEILPKMKSDPGYLKKKNMEIVSQNDSIPVIKQLPGKDNALGNVKFLFPNSYDIYLHDTPDKTLFARKDRALSHGCIRVADAEKLAKYILKDQSEWTAEKIRTAMTGNKEQTVEVTNKKPVYITYYTAWTDENGKMNFRNDIYGHDKETADRMFTRTG